ncbi:hypothetical protein NPIL_373821 [Nephila pilipes]|uniref:Uncharacterized protein n=1 Tax=Nephila pilipes TaxID=299642 RepID=A0A8X6P0C1_NEPPI|nr:hypothetical protein NPIL_373821 [Nephila pilipes]
MLSLRRAINRKKPANGLSSDCTTELRRRDNKTFGSRHRHEKYAIGLRDPSHASGVWRLSQGRRKTVFYLHPVFRRRVGSSSSFVQF